MTPPGRRAVVIGAGLGGLALGIRLQSLGFDTTVLEALDAPGGRARVRVQDGFTFDMGPTVLTVPHLYEELFALDRGRPDLSGPDFPGGGPTSSRRRADDGDSGGPATRRYVRLVPIEPFYRIYFEDGTHFDYDGDPEHTRAQIAQLAPEDLAGYERFHEAAEAIFRRGFLRLGYTHFGTVGSMVRVLPELLRLDAVRPLFTFAKRFFASDKMRRVFSFEPLLVGGDPLRVPALYAMIHFVEKTWGVHYAIGGTGALVRALVAKFEELGGTLRLGTPAVRIRVERDDAGRPRARGVETPGGTAVEADLVASNADYAHTYLKLVPHEFRRWNRPALVRRRPYSMSLFVLYFGFRADGTEGALRHHTIILGRRYEELLRDVFDRGVLSNDVSQYLHVPTLTDPSLAPPGHHAAYTLVPVPNQRSGLDWDALAEPFADRLVDVLDDRAYLPGLRERLVTRSFVAPNDFEHTLRSHLGNAFGPAPTLLGSAYFRPHNRSEDVRGLYLVGQGTQPGAGTPSVLMSAKMTARLVAADYGVSGGEGGGEAPAGGGAPE